MAQHNIGTYEQCLEVMGAAVRHCSTNRRIYTLRHDEDTLTKGLKPGHHAAFFSRLLLDVLPEQHAMLLLWISLYPN